jgi:hypothetical protein
MESVVRHEIMIIGALSRLAFLEFEKLVSLGHPVWRHMSARHARAV